MKLAALTFIALALVGCHSNKGGGNTTPPPTPPVVQLYECTLISATGSWAWESQEPVMIAERTNSHLVFDSVSHGRVDVSLDQRDQAFGWYGSFVYDNGGPVNFTNYVALDLVDLRLDCSQHYLGNPSDRAVWSIRLIVSAQ